LVLAKDQENAKQRVIAHFAECFIAKN